MSGSLSEDSAEAKKLPDKPRTHAFILELEQGSQEALKQRSVGKFDRLPRKELHSKERKEKERSLSDERGKLKLKQADDAQQRDGAALKLSSEEKAEKKSKIKSEKKTAGTARDGKPISEGASEEGAVRKAKAPSVENIRTDKERDKSREKEREREKNKDKAKGEKTPAKSDSKQNPRHDSVSLFEDRADVDPGSDGSKKKEKHSKDLLKRSKSHGDDKLGDKSKKDSDREKTKMDQDGHKLNKSSSEIDKDPKKVKFAEKGKIPEKSKSKSKEEAKALSKMDSKAQGLQAKSVGAAPKEKKKDLKESRKASEETQHDKLEVKSMKKKKEKEKRDSSQEEKKTPREDKLEKSEKSSKPSAVAPIAEEPTRKAAPLQDDLVATATSAPAPAPALSDDTCDALSDITPEPPEGELESRLVEISVVPGEADALLTLMDVCTSAEAQLPPAAEISEREADMKMQEAALTLLSMDCGAVTSALICHSGLGHQDEPPPPPPPELMETEVVEQEAEVELEHQHRPHDEVAAVEPPAGPNQASVQPEAEKETNTAGV